MDSVPLVCITGQVRSALIGTDAFQETYVFGITLSLTKWSRLVRTIDGIPAAIAEPFIGPQRAPGTGRGRYPDRPDESQERLPGP